jgi:hypothetical protein
VLQYDGFDMDTRTVTFVDVGSDAQISSVLTDTTGEYAGTINVAGHSYAVEVDGDVDDDDLTMEMNGDGSITTDEYALITTWGGFVIDPLDEVTNGSLTLSGADFAVTDIVGTSEDITTEGTGAWSVTFEGSVDTSLFDTSGGETFSWTIEESGTELDIDYASDYAGPLDGAVPFEFQFDEEKRNADVEVGLTDYGILLSQTDPDDSTDAKTLELTIPEEQVLVQVFVTLGDVVSTAGGSGMSDKLNAIPVGLGVLDIDAPALGTENLIVVGGPCKNIRAAELLGNPANCMEGFEDGKAMIKAYDQSGTVAILVAGAQAQDTLGASRVLAAYKDYSLSGSEVEVVVADLNSIKVNAVQ